MKNNLFFAVLMFLMALAMIVPAQPVQASPLPQTAPWCGTTSETQNYGFTMPLQQPHWTVNGEPYVSQSAIDEVDDLYDGLNNDNIANTMILFIDRNEVSSGSGCAGHFFFYMELGNVNGPRMANGMAIIFVITKNEGKVTDVEVHYSVGGNLGALQPVDLMEMDIIAKETLTRTGSLEETYLTVMRYFEQYARSKYEPYYPPTQTPSPAGNSQPAIPSVNHLSFLDTLCLSLLCIVGLIFLFWLFSKLSRGTRTRTTWTSPSTTTSQNWDRPSVSRPHSQPQSRHASRPSSPPSRSGGGNKSGPTRVG